jgi:hypothetical protein
VLPQPQWEVSCDQGEIPISRKQLQFVPKAELSEQGVDGADLNTRASTSIAKARGADVVFAIRHDERKCAEPVYDVFAGPRAGETLQEFL